MCEVRCALCHSGRVDLDDEGVCFGCHLAITDLAERTTPGAEELAEIADRLAVVRRLKDQSFARGEGGAVPLAALNRALPVRPAAKGGAA